jgi:hypothetical protein
MTPFDLLTWVGGIALLANWPSSWSGAESSGGSAG